MGFQIVPYKGKRIAVVDIARTTPGEAILVLGDAQKQIAQFPPKSALVLTDATDATYNQQSSAAVKEFAARNGPYVKASAVVGADGLRSVLLRLVATVTGRNIKPCRDRSEALEWLSSQP
jgi:hypothetical protein